MPFDPFQPFSRKEALAAGLTDRQLRGDGYTQLLGGIYVATSAPDLTRLRVSAAIKVHPAGAVATHFSAARLLGVPVPAHPLEHVTVARAEDRRQRHGLRCHVAALEKADVTLIEGLRVSDPHRMFVELASGLGLVDLAVVGDWLVRRKLVTPASLLEYSTRSHARHARAARRAATYVRCRVDSPMETRLRMLIVLAGLPEPEVNLTIKDVHGVVSMRLDLSYPRVKLAVEYDGRQHVEVIDQWERDVERRDELDDGSWRLLVVTSKGIYREPEKTVARIYRALRARGYRPLRPPSQGWRPHFGR